MMMNDESDCIIASPDSAGGYLTASEGSAGGGSGSNSSGYPSDEEKRHSPSDEERSNRDNDGDNNNQTREEHMEEGRSGIHINGNTNGNNNSDPSGKKADPPEQAPTITSANTASTRSGGSSSSAIHSEEDNNYEEEDDEEDKIKYYGRSSFFDTDDDDDDDDDEEDQDVFVVVDQMAQSAVTNRTTRVQRRGATKKRRSTGSVQLASSIPAIPTTAPLFRRSRTAEGAKAANPNPMLPKPKNRRSRTLETAPIEPSMGDFVKASATLDSNGRVPMESDEAALISAEMKIPSFQSISRSERVRHVRSHGLHQASRDLISTQAEMQLGVSVYYLQNHFLEEVFAAGLSLESTIYEIEDLRGSPGVVRQRGLHVRCPVDGKMGAAYVHCLEGSHNVGPSTHMLSYTWGYTIGDIVGTLVDFCKKEKLDPERTYFWICFLCVNQHRVVANTSVVPTSEFLQTFGQRVSNTKEILCMMSPWEKPLYLQRIWCIYELSQAFSQHHVKVNIALPPGEKLSLVKDLLLEIDDTANSPVDVLYDALNNIKVEEAKASQEEDRRLILDMLEQEPEGCEGTNELVKLHLKEHVLDILQGLGKQCSVFDAHQEAEVEEALTAAMDHFQELPQVEHPRQTRRRTVAELESYSLERKHRRLKIAFGILSFFLVGLAVAWVLDSFLRVRASYNNDE